MLHRLKARGGILGAIANALAPGVGPGVVLFICTTLVLLIALSGVAVMAGYYSFHMFNIILLAVGLGASVVWSYSIRSKLETEHRRREREAAIDDGEDSEEEEEEGEEEGEEEVTTSARGGTRSARGKTDDAKKNE